MLTFQKKRHWICPKGWHMWDSVPWFLCVVYLLCARGVVKWRDAGRCSQWSFTASRCIREERSDQGRTSGSCLWLSKQQTHTSNLQAKTDNIFRPSLSTTKFMNHWQKHKVPEPIVTLQITRQSAQNRKMWSENVLYFLSGVGYCLSSPFTVQPA